MMKRQNVVSTAATLLLGSMLLSGCGIAPTTAPDGSVGFPDRSSAWLKEGTFVNVENLRQVKPGLTKEQVYALIQEPHFNEGVFEVHVWNYIFDFRKTDGEVISCQYQVQYDRDMKVKATYWKTPECAAFVEGETPQSAGVTRPVVQEAPQVQHFTLQAEALFPFDRSAPSNISRKGRIELDRIATEINSQYRSINSITIMGYTDRIGSYAYNHKLSVARAEAVRDYLADHGVKIDAIHVIGMGDATPVATDCPAGHSAAAVQCLAPNRRVTVDMSGERNP